MPDLLPPNATAPERALSLATDRWPDVPIKTLWSPQTCPEAQLPWLAWALSVDDWDAAWPVETKRQVIAASIEQHRKKGTVGALRRALQRLGYEVEIDERTGTAYTFRLRVRVRAGESAGGSVAEDALNRAVTIALRQKNARSALLSTAYVAATDAPGVFIGGVTMSGLSYEAKESDDYTLPPTGLAIDQASDSFNFNATWSGDAEYYEYQWDLAANNFSAANGGVSYSASIAQAAPNSGQYAFRVRAFQNGEFSAWVTETFTIIVPQPTGLTATASANFLTVNWNSIGFNHEAQLCVAGNNWASVFPVSINPGVSFGPLGNGLYDLRVRHYDNLNNFSAWTQLLNISV